MSKPRLRAAPASTAWIRTELLITHSAPTMASPPVRADTAPAFACIQRPTPREPEKLHLLGVDASHGYTQRCADKEARSRSRAGEGQGSMSKRARKRERLTDPVRTPKKHSWVVRDTTEWGVSFMACRARHRGPTAHGKQRQHRHPKEAR